ncbi:hypothetical protein ROZALSC1DRAFT_31753 [Rozella allomycis CSF55]|uniref:Uncharacterized protein n=1 Tax=Rozella allomycis (strain CSF55) TaxID=988480 RepID=A0A4P9YAS6_ROZAC|nr:hypothetical protein ROZALSC1DRAFT_31753 [Rozella allomycis CSF55]
MYRQSKRFVTSHFEFYFNFPGNKKKDEKCIYITLSEKNNGKEIVKTKPYSIESGADIGFEVSGRNFARSLQTSKVFVNLGLATSNCDYQGKYASVRNLNVRLFDHLLGVYSDVQFDFLIKERRKEKKIETLCFYQFGNMRDSKIYVATTKRLGCYWCTHVPFKTPEELQKHLELCHSHFDITCEQDLTQSYQMIHFYMYADSDLSFKCEKNDFVWDSYRNSFDEKMPIMTREKNFDLKIYMKDM